MDHLDCPIDPLLCTSDISIWIARFDDAAL